MKYTVPLLLAVAVSAGSIVYMLNGRSSRNATKATEPNSQMWAPTSDQSRLEAVISGFERRLQQIELRLAANSAEVTTAPKSIEVSAPPALSPTERMEQSIARDAQMKAEIQERLKTEPRDRTWATATEDSIRSAAKTMAGERGSYSFASLSCLTSLCNVKILIPDIDGPQGTMYNLPASLRDIAAYQAPPPIKLDDGTYSVEFTMFRKGYPVPGQDEVP